MQLLFFFLAIFPSNTLVRVEFLFATPTTGSSDLQFCPIKSAEPWKTTHITFQHLVEDVHTYQQAAVMCCIEVHSPLVLPWIMLLLSKMQMLTSRTNLAADVKLLCKLNCSRLPLQELSHLKR